ncbi:MAG: DNA-3-methyladenine glycosylase 2 family protein [Patescibacteria group bacterium]|nr:DNA-3-methyladenine glycosylase 2 family protein [Patescibacteria group bacterium]
MAKLIKTYGPPDLSRYHASTPGVFQALLRSIVYQQLSGHAARAIHARLIDSFEKGKPTPEKLLKIPAKKLRAAGLSMQKIEYVRDLARKCIDGTIDPRHFPQMKSKEIIEHLTAVKGVGVWTAHMVLIFTLGRPDILPTGDLGIKKGFQSVFGLQELPTPKQMEKLAMPWRGHESIASWYLWRVADGEKPIARGK